jgi:hypothetical protein
VNPRRLILLAALPVAVACTSHGPSGPASTQAGPVSSAGAVSIAPADRPACAALFTHLQQVTGALSASSELIANAVDKQQLSERISNEQTQLKQSADLMAAGPVPTPLADANRQLVAALRAFTDDFARAKAPAARGDFQAATDAMTDQAVVQRIVDASKTIEDACG